MASRAKPSQSQHLDTSLLWNSTTGNPQFHVKCRDREWMLHDFVIDKCPFFNAAMKEAFPEGRSKSIDLSADEPDALEACLRSLYGIEYKIPRKRHAATFHAEVFALAHLYDIPALQKSVKSRFKQSVAGPEGLIDALKAAHIVYKKTPDTDYSLRQYIIHSLEKYASNATLGQDNNTRILLRACPDLAADLLLGQSRVLERDKDADVVGKYKYVCQSCSTPFQTTVKGPKKGARGKSRGNKGGGVELHQGIPGQVNLPQMYPGMGGPHPAAMGRMRMQGMMGFDPEQDTQEYDKAMNSKTAIWCPACGTRQEPDAMAAEYKKRYGRI